MFTRLISFLKYSDYTSGWLKSVSFPLKTRLSCITVRTKVSTVSGVVWTLSFFLRGRVAWTQWYLGILSFTSVVR